MNAPLAHRDPIEQLRAERPVVESSMPDVPIDVQPVTTRARRPRRARAILVAAVAGLAALAGVMFSGLETGESVSRLGISTAEARDIAFGALEELAELRRYESEYVITAREVGGDRRAEESVIHVVKVDDDYRFDSTWASDFLDRDANGLSALFVDGLHMEEAASSRYPQRWMLEATPAGAGSARRVPSPEVLAPPDFSQLVAQLERERLVAARRTGEGTVVVELRIDASKLVPVGGASRRPPDPIASFAQTITMASNLGRREAPIELTITVHQDGTRRIDVTGEIAKTYANGAGGTPQLMSTLTARWTWREDSSLEVAAPPPEDVLVVGRIPAARAGDTGPDGAHGTLADFTRPELQALGRRLAGHRQRTVLAGVRRERAASRRKDPRIWTAVEQFYEARRAEIDRDWLPIDRVAMSRSDRCQPFWPDSLRAMDPDVALSDPASAGWRCELRNGHGSISVLPGDERIDARAEVGSGVTHWVMPSR